MGERVRKIVHDKFRQRGHTERFSKQIFTIKSIVDSAPYVYHLTPGDEKKIYYAEQLQSVGDEKGSLTKTTNNWLSGIIKKKKVAVKFLRSGKPIQFEDQYLCLYGDSEKRYLNEKQVLAFENGKTLLDQFLHLKE